MSIEVNQERLSELSIADLIHLRDYYYAEKKWLPQNTRNREDVYNNLDECSKAIESTFEAKLKDIFIY